ncbi:MAG: hypothetical protein C4337_00315 [Armatimonadota bacterium]
MLRLWRRGRGAERSPTFRFEPFYATKPGGQGTGMGLSAVHGIVQQMDGRIEVDTQVGKGTTFRVILPIQT